MYRVLNIDSFNKKFILALVGEFIRFILFNFMYSFMNTWAANFEMVLFIANIANVSIRWGFTSEMWTVTNFMLFYKLSCVLVASVMIRLIKFPFKNLINVVGRLRSENFVGILTCFLSSMACTNCFGQSEVTFLKKPFTKGVISGTTNNYIFDQRVLEVVKFTFGT